MATTVITNYQAVLDGTNNVTAGGTLRESVSVFDFMTAVQIADVKTGAASIDVTDAVQNAINEAHGRQLIFPAGTYLIGGALTIGAPISIRGDGKGLSVLKAKAAFSDSSGMIKFAGTVSGVLFRDLTIDGNQDQNSGADYMLIHHNSATLSKLSFDNIEVKNSPYHGVYFGSAVSRVVFNNCDFKTNGMLGGGNDHGSNIYILGTNKITFTNCLFEDAWEHGAYLGSGEYVDVINCNFIGNGIRNPGAALSGSGLSYRCSNGKILGCVMRGNANEGLSLLGTSGTLSNITVIGNLIYGNLQTVTAKDREVMFSNVTDLIFSNNIIGNGDNTVPNGVKITGTKDRITVSGNRIRGYVTGVQVQAGSVADANNMQISGNYIEGNGSLSYGIGFFQTLTGDGLAITGNTVKAATIGISLANTVAINSVFVNGNTFIACANYDLYDLSTGTPRYGFSNNVSSGTAAPTSGTWKRGDIVWNTAPSAGATPGWVCTTGGTPGTWKAMASLAA